MTFACFFVMSDIDVDELIANHKKILKGAPRICKKCSIEMENMGIRMSMNVNYTVYKCPKCKTEELVYKGPAN